MNEEHGMSCRISNRHPARHPAPPVLVDYAGGALCEPAALVIATHLALCPLCRSRVAELEAACGTLLEQEETPPVSSACFDSVLARLDEPPGPPAPAAITPSTTLEMPLIPEPLRSYLGTSLTALSWQAVDDGTERANIKVGRTPIQVFLLRMKAGAAAPRHSHDGIEMNLVLGGRFHDERGAHERGDVVIDDAQVDHRPIADFKEGCLCLCLTDGPLRLTGKPTGLLRLLEPFARRQHKPVSLWRPKTLPLNPAETPS